MTIVIKQEAPDTALRDDHLVSGPVLEAVPLLLCFLMINFWAFLGALVVKNPPASAGDIRATVSIPGRADPLEDGRATHSSFLPGESNGQRSLAGYSPKGCKELGMIEVT